MQSSAFPCFTGAHTKVSFGRWSREQAEGSMCTLGLFLFHPRISLCYQDRHDSLISQRKPVTSSLIAYPKAGEL